MRTARLVGLSPDGKSLIVATDGGEELAIAADERLRAAVRGDRPRLGQLEIEMESALSPRDIQARIRSGETLEEVARAAGLPRERVERFAAPVLAERDHIATTALASSVRRRGETSGHRLLRATAEDRLQSRGIDASTVAWDSHRVEDGRWAVTADYRSGEAERHATFLFDPRGRFSIAVDDDARWLLSEQSPARGPQPGRRRPPGAAGEAIGPATGEPGLSDEEPTLDLNDELALVRATQETTSVTTVTEVTVLPAPQAEQPAAAAGLTLVEVLQPDADEEVREPEVEQDAADQDIANQNDADQDDSDQDDSPFGTLYGMLGGAFSGDAPKVYAGLSDASAVPETPDGGWEPPIVVNYPVEPSLQVEGEPTALEEPGDPSGRGTDEPPPPDKLVDLEDRVEEVREFESEGGEVEVEPIPPRKAPRRKRAAVPSWDEIMFGGPKSR